jgi:hypothetical protein
MKYILLIHGDEQAFAGRPETERQQIYSEYMQFSQQIRSSGHWVAGAPLHPTASAKSVRIRGGKPLVTDGPFAETREQLGGYFLVDARDLDEAIGIAARIPGARWGTVEVRPVVEASAPAAV